jgi:hypothetical protein
MSKLITNPDLLDNDATTLKKLAFTEKDEGWKKSYIEIAATLRRAAQAIRDGKIKGVPSR